MSDGKYPASGDYGESLAREHLANERTLLSWVRIGINAIGVGILLHVFVGLASGFPPDSALRRILPLDDRGDEFALFAVAIVVFGVVVEAISLTRYFQFRRTLERGEFTSSYLVYVLIAVGLSTLGVAYITYVVVG